MKKLSANVCAVTHTGRVRKENEDNYSLNGKVTLPGGLVKGKAYIQKMNEPFHLAVCDGMGGEMHGEVASGIAVEAIARHATSIYESGEDFSFAVSNCLDDANNRICSEITTRGVRLGTTLAAIYAVKGRVICVSLGDTRIYHFSNGILEQASFDHTHAQGFVDARELGEKEAGELPDAKRLTKHLGVFPEEATLSPNVSVIDDVDDGDIILLCSDGLTDMLSDEEISTIISMGDTPQDVSAKLVRKALEKGGKDNITVVTAFMNAEDTSVFAPIAEAMVGDKDPDYEEEYRNSYGANTAEETPADPYANADSQAAKKEIDKRKIVLIAGIVLAALMVIALAVIIIKSVAKKNEQVTTTTSVSDYYSSLTSQAPLTTWNNTTTTEFSETSSEEESSETTSTTTTRPYSSRRNNNNYGRNSNDSSKNNNSSSKNNNSSSSKNNNNSSSNTEPTASTSAIDSSTESTSPTEPTGTTGSDSSSSETQSSPTQGSTENSVDANSGTQATFSMDASHEGDGN